jgi:hypothetical protein
MLGCELIIAALTALEADSGRDYACEASPAHIAIALSEADATRYVDAMATGSARFEESFGKNAPRSAVVQGNAAIAALRPALREAGYVAALPWMDIEEQRTMIRDMVREQVAAGMPDAPQAQIDAVTDQALTGRLPNPLPPATEISAIQHEFGHI